MKYDKINYYQVQDLFIRFRILTMSVIQKILCSDVCYSDPFCGLCSTKCAFWLFDWGMQYLGQKFRQPANHCFPLILTIFVFNNYLAWFKLFAWHVSGAIAERSRACVHSGFVVGVPGLNPTQGHFFMNKKNCFFGSWMAD